MLEVGSVGGDDVSMPISGIFRCGLERVVIHMHQSEPELVALGPLEVANQRSRHKRRKKPIDEGTGAEEAVLFWPPGAA